MIEMNKTVSFKLGVTFAASIYMGKDFLDVPYGSELQSR